MVLFGEFMLNLTFLSTVVENPFSHKWDYTLCSLENWMISSLVNLVELALGPYIWIGMLGSADLHSVETGQSNNWAATPVD